MAQWLAAEWSLFGIRLQNWMLLAAAMAIVATLEAATARTRYGGDFPNLSEVAKGRKDLTVAQAMKLRRARGGI
jgi:hypothetical protein